MIKWITAIAVLPTLLAALAGPAWASFPGRNGRIAFIQGPDIYTMNADGSDVRQLTSLGPSNSAFYEAWSPDGLQLIFVEFPPGAPTQIWVMNADGSNQHQLFSDPLYNDFDPTFSPDGKEVVFTRCQLTGNCAIYRVEADGTGMTAVTNFDPNPDVSDIEPVYSPDGRRSRLPASREVASSARFI
jgi:Tol biopolymer transport system component